MEINIDILKSACDRLHYQWFPDRPHIIGVRSAKDEPDVFNDFLTIVYPEQGHSVVKVYQGTTDPGVYYQKNLLNTKGCLIMKPGQYVNAYALGHHQNKPNHRALIQVRAITVYRDPDKDGVAETAGMKEETGLFGANIHGAVAGAVTKKIGPWSAGCQVHADWSNKEKMMDECERFKAYVKNAYTYTLLTEKDIYNGI